MAAGRLPKRVGRYELFGEFARGGMASIHLGRLVGPVGFAKTVAVKVLHPEYASDPAVVRMFIDEARLTSRVSHPNVVPIIDVVAEDGNLCLVMDYIHGLGLARILADVAARKERIPVPIALAIVLDLLAGLHAAHEARGEDGRPLHIVHRDVSPQNVIVGDDGIARVLDFGVAKAASRLHQTTDGAVKGKLAYMAPEHAAGDAVDRRSDLFSACVVFWETLTAVQLFKRDAPAATMAAVLQGRIDPPSRHLPGLDRRIDPIVLSGLARESSERPRDALEIIRRIEALGSAASRHDVAEYLRAVRARIGEDDPMRRLGMDRSVVTLAPVAGASAPPPPPPPPPGGTTPLASHAGPAFGAGMTASVPAIHLGRAGSKPPVRRGAPIIAMLLGVVTALAIGIVVVQIRSGRQAALPSQTPTAPSAVAAAPLAPVDGPVVTEPPAAPLEAPPEAAPSASEAASVVASSASTTRPRSRSTPHAKRPSGGKPAPSDCRVVNADGTIGYRPECLR